MAVPAQRAPCSPLGHQRAPDHCPLQQSLARDPHPVTAPASRTHTGSRSFLWVSLLVVWSPGYKEQGNPEHSHGWGLIQAQEAFTGEPRSRPPTAPTPSSLCPPPPLRPIPLKHNLDRIQEASLKVIFPTPKLSNANFLFFFYWHDAIPLPTTQISEVLSHQAKAGTVGGAPQQGSKVWGARDFLPGPSALGPAPQTPGSGLLRPHTASSWFPPCARFQGGKVTAGGVQAPSSARGQPAAGAAPHVGPLGADEAPAGSPRRSQSTLCPPGDSRLHLRASGAVLTVGSRALASSGPGPSAQLNIHKAQDSPHQQAGSGPRDPRGQSAHTL